MGKLLLRLSSLIVFVFLSCVTELVRSQSPLVTTFCHNHIQDPAFCLQVIGTDPRFQTAKTAHDLEEVTIVVGAEFVRGITSKCTILLQREKDPNVRAALGSCSGSYSLLKLTFDSMKDAFQHARPLTELGAVATTAVLKCNFDFDDQKLISPLAKDNHDLLNFIQIIVGNAV